MLKLEIQSVGFYPRVFFTFLKNFLYHREPFVKRKRIRNKRLLSDCSGGEPVVELGEENELTTTIQSPGYPTSYDNEENVMWLFRRNNASLTFAIDVISHEVRSILFLKIFF